MIVRFNVDFISSWKKNVSTQLDAVRKNTREKARCDGNGYFRNKSCNGLRDTIYKTLMKRIKNRKPRSVGLIL